MKKFHDIYSKSEIEKAMKNKYLIFFKYELDDKVYISKKYGIVIRNINKIENDILSQSLIYKINEILSLFEKLDYIYNENKVEEIKKSFLKKYTDFDNKTIISYNLDGNEYYDLFDKIIFIIKENIDKIVSTNIEIVSKNIANIYLKNCIVLYSEKEELIYKIISDCTNYSIEDIDDFDKYDDFILKYVELWNSINFKQLNYYGIKVNNFNTKISSIINLFKLENMELYSEFVEVIKSPVQIDLENEKLFYFIINRFYSCYYMDDNSRILLYFSLLELMITRKPRGIKDISIIEQLCRNIILCSKKYPQINISEKEIKELYNYRSLLVHGSLTKTHKSLCKIRKYNFAKVLINDLDISEFANDDMFITDLVRIRTHEIFSYIYKIYCTDNQFIEKLKLNDKKSFLKKIKMLLLGGKYE